MTELTKRPCPHCESSDAFSYNTELQTGFCFSCKGPYPQRGKKYDQETLEEYPLGSSFDGGGVVKRESLPDSLYKFVPMRGISAQTMEFFNVRTYVIVVVSHYSKSTSTLVVVRRLGACLRPSPHQGCDRTNCLG